MGASKGTITFKDVKTNFSTMRFPDASDAKDKAGVATLQAVLETYSDCHVAGIGYVDKTKFTVAGADAVDNKAIITCQDGDGNVHKWALPGYNGTPVQDNDGWTMDTTERDACITAIAVFTGLTLSALRSPYIVTR